jgi:RNA-directed DNA polymerase
MEGRDLGSRRALKAARNGRLGNLVTPPSVQKLQTALHAKAKGEPGFRFYALYDKVYRDDVLRHAYDCCKANDGAAGVDEERFEDIEAYGLDRWLGGLAQELKEKRYTPQAARRVYIPKQSGSGLRPLSIPTIRDRTAQTAAKLVLEPIFGAPGEAWCFQRVKIPHRKGEEPPHRESSLGLMEVTTWVKRRQSDGRAVT